MTYHQTILQATRLLQNGGIILYPTDTIWGIGCDATNTQAVARIFALKHRADAQSMLSLVASLDMLAHYVNDIPQLVLALIDSSQRPTSIIYPDARNLAAGLQAPDGSAAFRIPHHALCIDIINSLERPIVSTSANISGAPHPNSYREIAPEIKNGVDFIIPEQYDTAHGTKSSRIVKILPGGLDLQIIRE